MVLVNGQWEDVQSLQDVSEIIRKQFSESLARQMNLLINKQESKVENLENEMNDLEDEIVMLECEVNYLKCKK